MSKKKFPDDLPKGTLATAVDIISASQITELGKFWGNIIGWRNEGETMGYARMYGLSDRRIKEDVLREYEKIGECFCGLLITLSKANYSQVNSRIDDFYLYCGNAIELLTEIAKAAQSFGKKLKIEVTKIEMKPLCAWTRKEYPQIERIRVIRNKAVHHFQPMAPFLPNRGPLIVFSFSGKSASDEEYRTVRFLREGKFRESSDAMKRDWETLCLFANAIFSFLNEIFNEEIMKKHIQHDGNQRNKIDLPKLKTKPEFCTEKEGAFPDECKGKLVLAHEEKTHSYWQCEKCKCYYLAKKA
ncbi:MAG: hypothetical protein HZA48_12340 [Planctomycetes bacterium]|nr:hypothetical protein [Planctomycetota bacterium]